MERLDGGNWTHEDIKFSTTHSSLSLSLSLSSSLSPSVTVALSERWNSRYNVSRQVKSSYAFRTVKLLFILGARGMAWREGEKRRTKGKREKAKNREDWQARRNHLATSNPLRTKLPSYHCASCQDVPRRLCTNANECKSVSGLTMPPPSLYLSFSRSRRGTRILWSSGRKILERNQRHSRAWNSKVTVFDVNFVPIEDSITRENWIAREQGRLKNVKCKGRGAAQRQADVISRHETQRRRKTLWDFANS